jgi:hypothetical protein
MARTKLADYQKSNRIRTLPLPDPVAAAESATRLLEVHDALSRRRLAAELLDALCRQTGLPGVELVVPDDPQPHRRAGTRIVYSLQGEYRRRTPTAADPGVARGGKSLGRIRVPNRTPARGDVVRSSAFLHTLLHEFCHHHDAFALGLQRSFHTAGFYARLRHLRSQVDTSPDLPPTKRRVRETPPLLSRLWSIIRDL